MVHLFVSALFLLIIIAYVRHLWQKQLEQKFKYKVYELRDRFRRMAIEGKVDASSDYFDYFDYTLSRAISQSYSLTIFYIVMLYLRNMSQVDSEESLALKKMLHEQLKANPELAALHAEYLYALAQYVIKQHYFTIRLVLFPLAKGLIGATRGRAAFDKFIESHLTFPETSGRANFAI